MPTNLRQVRCRNKSPECRIKGSFRMEPIVRKDGCWIPLRQMPVRTSAAIFFSFMFRFSFSVFFVAGDAKRKQKTPLSAAFSARSRTRASASWYHLGSPKPHDLGLTEYGSLLRYSSAMTDAPVAAYRSYQTWSVRGSGTMFGAAFRTPFQLPGLSGPYLRAYSSLHCLWLCYSILLG